MNEPEYRTRVYAQYRSRRADEGSAASLVFDPRWACAYLYYLRRWRPCNRDAMILDLGCGSGRLLRTLRDEGYSNVTGVDRSDEQLALARTVGVRVVDADALEYVERSKEAWDLILAIDLIEHLEKDEVLRLLDSARRGLRPQGRIVLQTLNGESPLVSAMRYADFTHETAFTPRSLAWLLRLSKFEEIESREMGPLPPRFGSRSAVRFVAWQALRACVRAWNLIETGDAGSGAYTRAFVMTALRPAWREGSHPSGR